MRPMRRCNIESHQQKENHLPHLIDMLDASQHYSDLLDCFSRKFEPTIVKPDSYLSGTAVSEAIFYHICKMKHAGWRHRVNFKRHRKHTFAEFFQDIIAFYLKALLPEEYSIELEVKKGKTQPDIVVKLNNCFHFLIEIKTTIGWNRPNMAESDPHKAVKERVSELSNNFSIPEGNVIYIFEDHGNVSKIFSDKYWDRKLKNSKVRPNEFPYSIYYPLFDKPDPCYWYTKGTLDINSSCPDIPDLMIHERAKSSIVTPFEEILRLITGHRVSGKG
ncbi:MAG: hypothetical protein HGB32_16070 [Geobacteraceae bacterium]|nr:hypothetical protein [Geobacteraceae bacterium]NTW81636.1 hypothetical protein [Geobacteraceae bacterium]